GLGMAGRDGHLDAGEHRGVRGSRLPRRGTAPGDPDAGRRAGPRPVQGAAHRPPDRAGPGGTPMSRWWTDQVAALGDHIPLGLAALLLLLAAALVGAGLYWWPHWLPWRWFRLTGARWPRLRWPWHWRWHWSLRWRWRWPWRRRRRTEPEPE